MGSLDVRDAGIAPLIATLANVQHARRGVVIVPAVPISPAVPNGLVSLVAQAAKTVHPIATLANVPNVRQGDVTVLVVPISPVSLDVRDAEIAPLIATLANVQHAQK